MFPTALRVVAAWIAVLLLCTPAFGQAVTGSMVGTVTDSSGASVVNAKLTLVESNTGISQTTNSNQSGNYSFPGIPPGNYRVEVELQGFRKSVRAGIDVLVNSTVRADLEFVRTRAIAPSEVA